MSSKEYTGFYLPERYSGKPRTEQVAAQILEVYSFKKCFWRPCDEQHLSPVGRLHRIL